jgi:hypothetical protein
VTVQTSSIFLPEPKVEGVQPTPFMTLIAGRIAALLDGGAYLMGTPDSKARY